MSFPKPVQLPEEVLSARKARSAAMVRIAIWGIGIRFGIAMFELAGFFAYKSSALLLDALSTFADVASSVLLIVSIKLAERPPDQDHPFGHGRYEPLVGLQLGIFLALGGMGLIVQQALGLMTAPSYSIHRFVLLIPLIAVICLECAYVMMRKVAKKENSPALEAEAFHFRIDSFNSLLALLALLFGAIIPEYSSLFDRMGALLIALFMCIVGCIAAKKNLNQLLDRLPADAFFELVTKAAKSVDGVLETEKIRIQQYGPDAHVDIDIEVDPKLSVEKAHTISQHVRSAIQKKWPQVRDVTVHIEPFYPNDHT